MLEVVIVSTKVIRECEGEMMWEKEYVEFAQTKTGGGVSDDVARARWRGWMADMSAQTLDPALYDHGGPECAKLRFWIKTRDRILFQDSVDRQKQLVMAEKEQKTWTKLLSMAFTSDCLSITTR